MQILDYLGIPPMTYSSRYLQLYAVKFQVAFDTEMYSKYVHKTNPFQKCTRSKIRDAIDRDCNSSAPKIKFCIHYEWITKYYSGIFTLKN